MQGRSLADLTAAGLQVEDGILRAECAALVRGFTRAITAGLPEVTCKAAITVDGNISTADGESQWITSPEARAHGHGLRASHDGIAVGIETVLADDPRLTCRTGGMHPRPIVFDTNLRTPGTARVLTHPAGAVLVCADDAPRRDLDAEVVRVPRGEGGVHMESALSAVAGLGMHRVLVEGGGRIHRSLLDGGLVDSLYLYIGGIALPGGRPWLAGPPVDSLTKGLRLPAPVITPFADDVLLRYALPHRLGV
jgi:diaminohydroxyphosphoribosylaminopyrimidine deaminase/5-amino-6-(5-phosphoribosylamino)uracil reductase